MSSNLKPTIVAKKAGADLSTHQGKLVKFDTTVDKVVLAGNDEEAIGVLENAPKAGQIAEVAVAGGTLVKVASNVNPNESVGCGASGVGKKAALGKFAIGKFLAGGVSGDMVEVIIDRHYAPAA